MMLTEESPSTRIKACPSATLSTTNLKWADVEEKTGLRGGRLETKPPELCYAPFCLFVFGATAPSGLGPPDAREF